MMIVSLVVATRRVTQLSSRPRRLSLSMSLTVSIDCCLNLLPPHQIDDYEASSSRQTRPEREALVKSRILATNERKERTETSAARAFVIFGSRPLLFA